MTKIYFFSQKNNVHKNKPESLAKKVAVNKKPTLCFFRSKMTKKCETKMYLTSLVLAIVRTECLSINTKNLYLGTPLVKYL